MFMFSRKKFFLTLLVFSFALLMTGKGMAQDRNNSYSDAFEKVNPAVVKIITLEGGALNDESMAAVSSGVVISEKGQILTAAHVVNVADQIAVKFMDDDQMIEANVVALSTEADIALLQLVDVPPALEVARLGDSGALRVGDPIFVIGAPFGLDHTLSVGHISGRHQSPTICSSLEPFEFLQTDASINQGNSGGPMFDMEGNIVGIVSRILSQSGGSVGLGFAVSVNTAKALLLEEKSFWIGFNARLISGSLARAFNLPQDAGLLVQRVAENSPGDKLGLRAGNINVQIEDASFLVGGDVILAIQGVPVTEKVENVCAIQDVVGGFGSDSQIEIIILREGKILKLTGSK